MTNVHVIDGLTIRLLTDFSFVLEKKPSAIELESPLFLSAASFCLSPGRQPLSWVGVCVLLLQICVLLLVFVFTDSLGYVFQSMYILCLSEACLFAQHYMLFFFPSLSSGRKQKRN